MKTSGRNRPGSLKVVGLGPAGRKWMSPPALDAICRAQVVCGYGTYIELIRDILSPEQEIVQTGMRKERDRCKKAIELALAGKDVVLVCSGDPGIYALAGLVFEMLRKDGISAEDLSVEVVPGMPALSACAALLGAPLVHDFSVISLSDLLTPWELIERRIEAAAMADFVIVFYNPRSRKRRSHLPAALDIVARHRSGQTPVGIATRAMRQGQETHVTTLDEIRSSGPERWGIGMQSLLIVGNSQTFVHQGKMVTPRGYEV